jgi:Uma2 family endonuclease
MTMLTRQRMSVAAFDEWVKDADGDYEYIRGAVYEVVSNNYSSQVGILIGGMLAVYVAQHRLGQVTGADGGYQVMGERYIPDAGFISRAKQPNPSRAAYNPNPPDLAIEVLSPSDTDEKMRVKVANYVAAGAVVWVIDPDAKAVEIYVPGQGVRVIGTDDVLDGGELLPGFRVNVADIFPAEQS